MNISIIKRKGSSRRVNISIIKRKGSIRRVNISIIKNIYSCKGEHASLKDDFCSFSLI